jgi:hypothetical protein
MRDLTKAKGTLSPVNFTDRSIGGWIFVCYDAASRVRSTVASTIPASTLHS